MPGSDTKNLTEVEKWKIYAEVCKWTDQKTGKIVNNGIERIIEGVKVENRPVRQFALYLANHRFICRPCDTQRRTSPS